MSLPQIVPMKQNYLVYRTSVTNMLKCWYKYIERKFLSKQKMLFGIIND